MMTLYYIFDELRSQCLAWISARPALRYWAAVGGVACALALAASILLFMLYGPQSDPFSYRRVSGTILYEDGTVIAVPELTLTFIPTAGVAKGARSPRPGCAVVQPETGGFDSASTKRQGDGLVAGTHKVIVTGPNRIPLAKELLSPEYAAVDTTPLQVDTAVPRFDLRVRRPPPSGPATRPRR